MKILILFLFLSFACGGQVNLIGDSVPFDFPIYIEAPIKKLSLEEKLLRYADECYNDSTEDVWAREYKYTPVDSGGYTMMYEIISTKYIHRKPTFEGFIEWLRKK